MLFERLMQFRQHLPTKPIFKHEIWTIQLAPIRTDFQLHYLDWFRQLHNSAFIIFFFSVLPIEIDTNRPTVIEFLR